MTESTWDPWTRYKNNDDLVEIPEPPCRNCRYWNPARDNPPFGGILCCHAEEMFGDFSCFRQREVKDGRLRNK